MRINPRKSAPSWERCLVVLALLTGFSAVGAGPVLAAPSDVVQTQSNKSFDQTVAALNHEIVAHGLVVVNKIPYTTMLSMVGVHADQALGIEFFHPRLGSIVYSADRTGLLNAPLRLLVEENGGKVMVYYRKPSSLFESYNGLGGLGNQLDNTVSAIVTAATK
jgi:uncharacterized protein (DUF302 family)